MLFIGSVRANLLESKPLPYIYIRTRIWVGATVASQTQQNRHSQNPCQPQDPGLFRASTGTPKFVPQLIARILHIRNPPVTSVDSPLDVHYCTSVCQMQQHHRGFSPLSVATVAHDEVYKRVEHGRAREGFMRVTFKNNRIVQQEPLVVKNLNTTTG